MRKAYPSDITREQFEMIREELEGAKKKTHPRKYELYDIFCAILYMLKEGCSWRGIPYDHPNWQNVCYHYDIWSKPDDDGISLLDLILRKLVETERKENNRSEQTTMIIKVFKMQIQPKATGMMQEKNFGNKAAYRRRHSRTASFNYDNNSRRYRPLHSGHRTLCVFCCAKQVFIAIIFSPPLFTL